MKRLSFDWGKTQQKTRIERPKRFGQQTVGNFAQIWLREKKKNPRRTGQTGQTPDILPPKLQNQTDSNAMHRLKSKLISSRYGE